MKLVLIRHGQSEANKDENIYFRKKDHQIELTKLGKKQALKAGKELLNFVNTNKGFGSLLDQKIKSNVSIFVSPYTRTRQTWALIKKQLSRKVHMREEESPLLREQEYKVFADKLDQEMKKRERDEFGPFYYRFKNAESVADVHLRVQTFYNYLMIQRSRGKVDDIVVVVAHEVVIRMFLMIIDGLKHENAYKVVNNCELIIRDI